MWVSTKNLVKNTPPPRFLIALVAERISNALLRRSTQVRILPRVPKKIIALVAQLDMSGGLAVSDNKGDENEQH
jgi:hypothetical protein